MVSRRRKLQVNRIKNHKDKWIQGEEKTAKVAIRHFNKIFNLPTSSIDPTILNCITKRITDENRNRMDEIPSEEEIKNAVFDL